MRHFSLLLAIGQLAVAAPSESTNAACKEIAAEIVNRVAFPLSLKFTSESNDYWSTALRGIKPACIVAAESAEDVSAAVKILNKYPDVRFTAKSGGHDPNPGHATVKDGILISLNKISGTTYDKEKNLVYVKPGGEWNDVIAALDKESVTIVGGRLGLVGIGGYLLQGGISFLSAQYGLAADSIVGWEVVAANGSIVNINAERQPDLAVAMRGSGSQFGIVTEFTIQANPIGKVWGGLRLYDSKQSERIFQALHDFVPASNDDPKAGLIVTRSFGSISGFLMFLFYDGEEPPSSGPFADLLEIPYLINQAKAQSYSQMLKANGAGASLYNFRISFRTFTIPYISDNPEIYSEITDKMQELTADYFKNPLNLVSQCSVDFQPLPAIVGKNSEKRGGNAMGLSASDPDRVIIEIQCAWPFSKDDEVLRGFSRDLTDWLESKVPTWLSGKDDVYLPLFMNDAASDQNVTESYRDYAKFKALQAQEDPQGMFRDRIGGFKY